MQYDLPNATPLFKGSLYIHTLAKLPQSPPIIMTKIKSTDEIIINYILNCPANSMKPSNKN